MKNKILIVDDNDDNLSVIGNLLINANYTVQVARDGESAIKIVHHKMPDLILLDIRMPGMSGYDVCITLKKDSSTTNIPIIFLTANSETEDIVYGFELGAVDYITKPFNKAELLSRVHTHLNLINARKELEQKNTELKSLNATKDKFFSIIAHDLKGPISSMMQIAEMLSNNEIKDEITLAKVFTTQKELTKNTYSLLENLLHWAKQNSEQILFRPQKIMLSKLLDNNITGIKFKAKQKAISIEKDYLKTFEVYADLDMVNLIVRNLLSNAVKFTTEGGTIAIKVEDLSDAVKVQVIDTGIGMEKKIVDKILSDNEYYWTLGTNQEQGTGLGIKLVKNFIHQNKGIFNIESEVNKGSCFSFTLPKA
ncbi:MAG: hybrid sensor histidine kinase/response regulator [Bacteroidales bacterium]|nr:hybrid sensor histidine kinase/response regulator [Bacteroidales bacterium]